MKKIAIVCAVLFSLTTVSAQNYKMGLGVRFSNDDAVVNNSLSFKYFSSESTAVESLFSLGKPFALGLLVEKHKPVFSKGFNYFFGGGAYAALGKTKQGESRNAGLQGVLGLDYKVPLLPINFSIDWKPEINLTNEFSFEPAAIGLSARFTLR